MPTWSNMGFHQKVATETCMICRQQKKCNEVKVVRYGRTPANSRLCWWVCSKCWNQGESGLVVYCP